MSRKKKYVSAIIPAVSLFLLLFLFLLSGLISLGQQLNSVSPILAWLYGLIVLACLGAGIIWLAYCKCLEAPHLFYVHASLP